jgi:hypothetical protein
LGPEGPVVFLVRGWLNFRTCTVAGGTPERSRYRPYFENYTVDASILDPDLSGSEIYMVNDAAPSGAASITGQSPVAFGSPAIDSKLM